jgi:hypothetical protein
MCRWLLAATLALGGCALVSPPSPDSTRKDLAFGFDPPADLAFVVRSNDDMAMPPPRRNDAGMPITIVDMARPLPTGDMTMVACSAAQHLVINEVQANGVGDPSNEFIEIYNPCLTADVPLAGWKLMHRSASGTSDQPIIPLQPTTTPKKVMMGGYYLVAGPTFKQSAFDVQYSQAALSPTGGGLALVDGAGKIVDSMGWGTASTNAYIVGAPVASPPDGQSVARTPNGSSANGDDSKDFKIAATPTPRAPN